MTGRELDRGVRAELASLGAFNSALVARHLVMVGRLIDDDPEEAWAHALAARGRGARIASVREAAGLAAYRSNRYAQALAELRTWRRLTGSNLHLPVMADCERGLGRPERALDMIGAGQKEKLDRDTKIELQIVAAGARADLGQFDAAVLALALPELTALTEDETVLRLRIAYAGALAAAGRGDEATEFATRYGLELRADGSVVMPGDDDDEELWDAHEDESEADDVATDSADGDLDDEDDDLDDEDDDLDDDDEDNDEEDEDDVEPGEQP